MLNAYTTTPIEKNKKTIQFLPLLKSYFWFLAMDVELKQHKESEFKDSTDVQYRVAVAVTVTTVS